MVTKKSASSKKSSTATKKQSAKTTTVRSVSSSSKTKSNKLGFGSGRFPMLGACIAEFIGVFVLASVAVLTNGEPLYIGFTLIAVVLFVGTLSGSHVNPLVTVGAWATRKINSPRAVGYLVAQFLGATLALVVMTAFVGAAPDQSTTAGQMMPQQHAELFHAKSVDDAKVWYVFFAEMLGAVIFGFAFSSAMREKRDRVAKAVTIGFGYMAALLVASVAASYATIGLVGIVNPATAITLQAIDWSDTQLWSVLIYLVSPIIGGVVGFFLFDVLRGENDGGDDHLLTDHYDK